MIEAKSYKGLLKQFTALSPEARSYLNGLEALLASPTTFAPALAFLFMKLEEGNHRALKCGLTRIHKCNQKKMVDALDKQHFTRPYFRSVFKNVFGEEIARDAADAAQKSEEIRDRLIHGKGVSAPELRDAIANALKYVDLLGKQVEGKTGKNPFGDLRGLAGKSTMMDTVPTFWLLKGIGFFNDKGATGP